MIDNILHKLIIDGENIYLYDKNKIEEYINENGDYACKNQLILEAIILSSLNKLNSSHFPKLLDLYENNNQIYLITDNLKEQYLKQLNVDTKNVIIFQILFALYESKVFEFNHNNLTLDNIYLENVEEEIIEYIINGYKYTMFNHGINVKIINFGKSRITIYKTYIFNEFDRHKEDYDVLYNQSNDLKVLDFLLDDSSFNKLSKLKKITIFSVMSVLFGIPLKYLNDQNKTINEIKQKKSNDEISKYIANYPKKILTKFNNIDIFNHLVNNKYNRLLYKFLTLFDIKLDLSKININCESYSNNRKIINKLKEVFNKSLIVDEIKEIYNPILLKYYYKEEWLNDKNNIILNIDNRKYGVNNIIFKDIPDNNIIKYKSTKYINLNKYGMNAIINLNVFINSINSNVNELIIYKQEKNLIVNYKSYNFNNEENLSLKNYTYQWDEAINRYLRENINDNEYLKNKNFLEYYDRFGDFPEESLENIKENIKNIDNAFLNTHISKENFVVYRGTKDFILYDGLNLGFISTTTNFDVAYEFAKNGHTMGCIYEMNISPGIPYIYLEDFTLKEEENEILLPRNLVVTMKKRIGNRYIVNVTLSSVDQFKIDDKYQRYYESKILGYNEDEKVIVDEITGDEIDLDNFIENDGIYYNKSTILNIFKTTFNKFLNEEEKNIFVDPFTRIPFNDNIILEMFDLSPEYTEYDKLNFLIFSGNFKLFTYLFNEKNIDDFLINSISYGIYNNLLFIKFLLEKGANINTKNDKPLMEAINTNNLLFTEFLLKNGSNIHIENDKPLIEASIIGNLEMIKLLVNYGANIHAKGEDALMNSIGLEFVQNVSFFIKQGANIHVEDCLFSALSMRNTEIIKLLLESGADIHIFDKDDDIIRELILSGKVEIIELLIEYGMNINKYIKDDIFIGKLIISYYSKMIKLFIKYGMNINIYAKNDKLLFYCFSHNNLEVFKLLIQYGGNIHLYNDKFLFEAAENGLLDIILFLIEYGVDICTQNNKALLIAVENNKIEMVILLLENGADIHTQNDKALISAVRKNQVEMVILLLENGANVHEQNDKALIFAVKNKKWKLVKLLNKYKTN